MAKERIGLIILRHQLRQNALDLIDYNQQLELIFPSGDGIIDIYMMSSLQVRGLPEMGLSWCKYTDFKLKASTLSLHQCD